MANDVQPRYDPDYVSIPGETILETIEALGMSQAELSERTGRSKKFVNEMIKGKAPITPQTAIQLERVLGMPASFWNNLEGAYRENLERVKEQERFSEYVDWLDAFPVSEMVARGWIEHCRDNVAQLVELLNFFGIVSPTQWETFYADSAACLRLSQSYEADRNAVLAWLRQGELEGHRKHCEPFDKAGFQNVVRRARELTASDDAVGAIDQIIEQAATVGVAVLLVGELSGTRASGATRWLSPSKALIQLSLRYKRADQFWFTFFHESGHILLGHRKRSIFVNDGNPDTGGDEEREADEFSKDFLIPPHRYRQFAGGITNGIVSAEAVKLFARQIGVGPGIVVGRLQHDRVIQYSILNGLRIRLDWAA